MLRNLLVVSSKGTVASAAAVRTGSKINLRAAKSLETSVRSAHVSAKVPSSLKTRVPSSKVAAIGLDRIVRGYASTSTALSAETREFQAETRKLLDIVTHSIYTDKEVFLRELISNASDALEKYRYLQVTQAGVDAAIHADAQPLEINLYTDKDKKTLTLIDNGIGMSKDELISNLGTIARSGSKQFVEKLQEKGTTKDGDNIIGQFGVGFYSSFMVSDNVSVESISSSGGSCHTWSSDGSGHFKIQETTPTEAGFVRGSKLTMSLKESCVEYCDEEKIKSVIKKYSSFVSFPIKLNGQVVNTVSALWTQDKKSVTEAQYKEFYKFISNAYDEPKFTLHFRADAPIDLKCLFFVPSFHSEKYGMGRMELGVNLYSRKVLIESKPKDLLPDWLRFVKGVVDSEDLPLSLSREKPQDSNLLRRIREVLTRKLIRFLEEQARDEPEKYREFYIEYNVFLKEGICHDFKFADQIAKLLRFESSALGTGELTSFDDYISRCPPEQKDVYYLVAPSRDAALASPYYETFKKHKREVLFLYQTIDDFVMSNTKTYSGRALVSAEASSVKLDEAAGDNKEEGENKDKDKSKESESGAEGLDETKAGVLCSWLKNNLGEGRVRDVKTTNRLSDSPAIVTDHESGALRRMMKLLEQSGNAGGSKEYGLPPQVFEINPKHPIMVDLLAAVESGRDDIAKLVAEQIFDNALIAAGLVDDARSMLPRINSLLKASLKK